MQNTLIAIPPTLPALLLNMVWWSYKDSKSCAESRKILKYISHSIKSI